MLFDGLKQQIQSFFGPSDPLSSSTQVASNKVRYEGLLASLVVTSATLVVTGATLLVTRSNNCLLLWPAGPGLDPVAESIPAGHRLTI